MAGGRPPGPSPLGKPANSGRRKGSLDKGERQLLTARLANDILETYLALGGVDFLRSWAEKNQTDFIRLALARLMPPMPRDDSDQLAVSVQTNLSDIESATRIAFVLSRAGQQLDAPIDADPLVPDPDPVAQTPAPTAATPVPTAAPVADPAARNEAWASLLPPTAAERDAQAATQQTPDAHHGGAEEQARPRPPHPGMPRSRSDLL